MGGVVCVPTCRAQKRALPRHLLCSNLPSLARFQRAAGKNAFQLLSQHRYDVAAAFFLLARQCVPLVHLLCCLGKGVGCGRAHHL